MAGNLPQVGLEAVIAGLPGFNSGAQAIISAYDSIEAKARNVEKATGIMGNAFSSITSPIGALSGQFVNLGQGVLKFGAIAGGIALAGVGALTAGFVALGGTALNETAKYERMSLSITNLVAREISQGQVVEQQIQTRTALTKKENEELANIPQRLKDEELGRQTLAAQMQEQKQRIIELTASYGDNGLNVQTAKNRLAEMENEYSKSGVEIDKLNKRVEELNNKNGQLTTTLQKVRTGQMSMTDAMGQAGPRAKELLKWIQILAIQSPFTQEGIAEAFRTALAYGFTTEKAQRLTSAMVDFTSATGKTEQSANLIALALGQIQARGKLSAQELRQLSEQGVGVNAILDRMGFSLDDVTNGLVSTDDFIEAVLQDMEVFSGAAKSQSGTLSGLTASMSDLKSIGLREFFTGTFKAIQPYMMRFVNFLMNAAIETGSIKALGEALGNYVGNALKNIGTFIAVIQAGGLAVFSNYLGVEGIPLWYQLQELIGNISTALSSLGSLISNNLSGPFSNFTSSIIPMITQGITLINDNFEAFKGALMGIGAVLAVGVFAALVAGIMALLTPINLIIAGAALLGAAWMGNWGNIQGITYSVWATIQPVLLQLWTWLQTNIPVAIQYLSTAWTNILLPAITTIYGFISGTLIPLFASFVTGYIDVTATRAQVLADTWTGYLLPAITAVWSFWNSSLMPLFVAFIDFVNAVVTKAIQALAGLWRNVLLPALNSVWQFIQSNLAPIFLSLSGTLTEKLSPPLKKLTEDILPSFKTVMDGVAAAIKKATDFFSGLASAVKNFTLPPILQPGSPSPLEIALTGIANAAQQAGQAITGMVSQSAIDSILGLNRHIADNQNVVSQASRALARFYEANRLETGKRDLATRQITTLFTQHQQEILGSANPVEMFKQLAHQTGIIGQGAGFSGTPGAIAQRGFEAFLKGFREASDRLQKAQQQAIIQAGKTALTIGNQLNDIVTSSADILDQRVKTLQELVSGGEAQVNYEGNIISATEAQDKLNQALKEQQAIQEQILIEKQNEMKLNFLEKQLSLVESISQAGLNVNDILGGLTLGLDASIPDMIAATNRLVTAMITQVNADLQMHSPSKVMTKLFQQAGMGAVGGLVNTIPAIRDVASQIGNAIISVPAALAGGGGYSTTNNYNFSMTVPTTSSPQATINQFQVMRAMVS